MLDPEAYAQRVIELHGGRDRFLAFMEQRRQEFNAVWQQDADRIGRVLRAHLTVEHFLTEYLAFANPHLGSIVEARLSFIQKVELLPDDDPVMSFVKPGLRRLNAIRNRIAHRLRVDVCEEDRKEILGILLFRAMRSEIAQREGSKLDDPLSVVEQFAQFAAGHLHASCNPERDLWRQAAQPTQADAQPHPTADSEQS